MTFDAETARVLVDGAKWLLTWGGPPMVGLLAARFILLPAWVAWCGRNKGG